MKRYLFPPLALPFLLIFLIILPILFFLFAGTITTAFSRLGLPAPVAYALFWAALIGSFVNIPIMELKSYGPVVRVREVSFFGIRYPVPYVDWDEQKTVVAVNVGGALVPLSVVLFEILRLVALKEYTLLLKVALATLIASLIIHSFAKSVRGLGIAVPTLLPPLVAVAMAFLFGGNMPLIAYTSGTLGVLIGADLMNMDKIKSLGAPMASIGGAGTFDGIFLAGILAVLLV